MCTKFDGIWKFLYNIIVDEIEIYWLTKIKCFPDTLFSRIKSCCKELMNWYVVYVYVLCLDTIIGICNCN